MQTGAVPVKPPPQLFPEKSACVAKPNGFPLVCAAGLIQKGECPMCDYSLTNVRSHPAQVGDKLTTRDFGLGTRGFAAAEDADVAVCVLPGTELSFTGQVMCLSTGLFPWRPRPIEYKTAIFRQINKD